MRLFTWVVGVAAVFNGVLGIGYIVDGNPRWIDKFLISVWMGLTILWYRKAHRESEEKHCGHTEIFQSQPEKVKCETCKHWIDKEDAQVVKTYGRIGVSERYYCVMHQLPYDYRKIPMCYGNLTDKVQYFSRKERQVTENGEDISLMLMNAIKIVNKTKAVDDLLARIIGKPTKKKK